VQSTLRALAWLLRIGVLGLCLAAIYPTPARVQVLEAAMPQQAHPQVCVHTRLIDEVEEWKIQRSLVEARELGATHIVEFFPWAYIERAPGQYDWAQADRILFHARNQGLTVIARMGFVPDWARRTPDETPTTLNTLFPEAYPDFARFVAAFAERYAGAADHLIIWNEPNLAFEWGYRPVSAAEYTDLLRVVYPAVRAANPNAVVLAAPLAPTLEPRGSAGGLNDLFYLQDLYHAGAAAYFDALAVHTYGFTSPALQAPAPDRLNYRRAELLRDIMEAAGDAATPVYITETGWNDHPRWTMAVSPAQRAQYTVDALAYSERNWPWARAVCIWMLRTPAPTFAYPDHFTLLSTEFERNPIFDAIRAFAYDLEVP
jgi:hypothetical protein